MLFFGLSLDNCPIRPTHALHSKFQFSFSILYLPFPCFLLSLYMCFFLDYPCRLSFSFSSFYFIELEYQTRKFPKGIAYKLVVVFQGGSGLVMVQAKIPNSQDTQIVWDFAFGTALKQKIGMNGCFPKPSFTIKFNF